MQDILVKVLIFSSTHIKMCKYMWEDRVNNLIRIEIMLYPYKKNDTELNKIRSKAIRKEHVPALKMNWATTQQRHGQSAKRQLQRWWNIFSVKYCILHPRGEESDTKKQKSSCHHYFGKTRNCIKSLWSTAQKSWVIFQLRWQESG